MKFSLFSLVLAKEKASLSQKDDKPPNVYDMIVS
jgi:hypothetical protein